jgi:tetratricopeptide repeat protein
MNSRELGLTSLRSGDAVAAISHFQEAIRQTPDDSQSWGALGIALCQAGRPADGVRALHKAISLQPDRGSFYYNLGRGLELLDRQADALQAYRRAVALDGAHAQAAAAVQRLEAAKPSPGEEVRPAQPPAPTPAPPAAVPAPGNGAAPANAWKNGGMAVPTSPAPAPAPAPPLAVSAPALAGSLSDFNIAAPGSSPPTQKAPEATVSTLVPTSGPAWPAPASSYSGAYSGGESGFSPFAAPPPPSMGAPAPWAPAPYASTPAPYGGTTAPAPTEFPASRKSEGSGNGAKIAIGGIASVIAVAVFLGLRLFNALNRTGMLPGGTNLSSAAPGPVIREPSYGFSVTLPQGFTRPAPRNRTMPLGLGGSAASIEYDAGARSAECFIMCIGFPDQAFDKVPAQEFFSEIRSGLPGQLQSTLTGTRGMQYQGYTTEENQFEATHKGRKVYGRMRLIAARPRFFIVAFIGAGKKDPGTPAANAFLDSLRIDAGVTPPGVRMPSQPGGNWEPSFPTMPAWPDVSFEPPDMPMPEPPRSPRGHSEPPPMRAPQPMPAPQLSEPDIPPTPNVRPMPGPGMQPAPGMNNGPGTPPGMDPTAVPGPRPGYGPGGPGFGPPPFPRPGFGPRPFPGPGGGPGGDPAGSGAGFNGPGFPAPGP